jgi:putative membrane protein
MVGISKASSLFNTEQRNTIKEAIVEAEKHTSGEIIPVVSSSSGRYDRAEDIFGLLFSMLAVTTIWILFHGNSDDSWSSFSFGLSAILITIFFSFIIGVLLTHLFPVLRLPFISKKEMEEEIEQAAAAAFQKNRLRNTENGTGILIYISLYERQVKVLGDDGISSKLEHADWEHICEAIINSFKEKQYTNGIVEGVKLSGELLSKHFPIQAGDVDELENELILID